MAGHSWAELEALSLATPDGAAPRDWIDALSDPDSDLGPPGGETGRAFHERSVQILGDVNEAEQIAGQMTTLPRGVLRVTIPLSYAQHRLGSIIGAYTQA